MAKIKTSSAIYYGAPIQVIVRWGKNGRKYVWNNPTQKVLDKLVKKYNVDQICDYCLWLEE